MRRCLLAADCIDTVPEDCSVVATDRIHEQRCLRHSAKRWDLSRLAQSPAADAAVLAEQGLEGWAVNLDTEDR